MAARAPGLPESLGHEVQTRLAPLLEFVADRVADLVVEHLAEKDGGPSPWLNSREAAEYLRLDPRTGPKRMSELHRTGSLRCARDGTRLLFRRAWLDDYMESSA